VKGNPESKFRLGSITEDFDREHPTLTTDTLSEKARDLISANERLTALAALNLQLQEREARLREHDAGLRRAQLMARLAHVITRPDGSFESWSDTLPELIDVEPSRMPASTREWLSLLHPDDRALFRATAIEAALAGDPAASFIPPPRFAIARTLLRSSSIGTRTWKILSSIPIDSMRCSRLALTLFS